MPTDERSLDPDDWNTARRLAHRMVDDAVDHLAQIRARPVWQAMPDAVRARFTAPAPRKPSPLDSVYDQLRDNLLPYSMGNIHPRFWGWYMGSGNFTGALGDFLAAIDGSNLGGGNTAAAAVDSQVVDWFKELMGYPASAGGTLTSGGSAANLIALTVARDASTEVDVRAESVAALPRPLRFYASDQVHSCHPKALQILGLGTRSLRQVPTDAHQRMDLDALERAIAQDRADGFQPSCVIATAGTTNTGAIDDLRAIAALCRREEMWFHVDGCIGALVRIAPRHKALVDGIEQADSIALDPHKWLHTPFEAGCILIRNARLHFDSFQMHGDYLQLQERGVIGGRFLADYGIELSRGFKALKIWMSLMEHGADRFGQLIDRNIDQAQYLERLIAADDRLELAAPVDLNIVCFRYIGTETDPARFKALNTEIMLRIQEAGIAVPSDTSLAGAHCLRVAINNHRTRRADLDLFVAELVRIGDAIASEARATQV